jgi:hypothetical protein
MSELGRILLLAGLLIATAGLLLLLMSRVPWLGRLPGDFYYRRGNFVVYFPLATAILVSLIVTILLSLLRR